MYSWIRSYWILIVPVSQRYRFIALKCHANEWNGAGLMDFGFLLMISDFPSSLLFTQSNIASRAHNTTDWLLTVDNQSDEGKLIYFFPEASKYKFHPSSNRLLFVSVQLGNVHKTVLNTSFYCKITCKNEIPACRAYRLLELGVALSMCEAIGFSDWQPPNKRLARNA